MAIKMKSVSVVLPMFNERDYVKDSVGQIVASLETAYPDFEIVIVDDASTDGSGLVADALAARDKRIRAIHHKKNRKLGGSLKSGFSAAGKEIVVYADIDMPFDYSLLRDILPLSDKADIINGVRLGHRESLKKLVYSKIYNWLIRFLFGLKVRDVNFSLKIFKKEALGALELKSEGSFISAEALVKAQYLGYKIIEVPVSYHPRKRGRSRLTSLGVILKIIYEMLKFAPQILALRNKALDNARLPVKDKLHYFLRRKTCPFQAIERYIPDEGSIYDLGCGYGTILEFLCNSLNGKRRFTGLDIDEAKINTASRMWHQDNLRFAVRDITEDLCLSNVNCLLLVDSLMLLPFVEQEKLLRRCWDYLSDEGRLLIKEIDKSPFLKYAFHQVQETLVLKFFGLIKGQGIFCRSKDELIALLEKIGYRVNAIALDKGYLCPHILYVCQKGR